MTKQSTKIADIIVSLFQAGGDRRAAIPVQTLVKLTIVQNI
jgi:hypothetical protein